MNIANMIDHTLLKADARQEEIERIVEEAKRCHFASVCVNPYWVKLAADQLKGTDVHVCTVIGFPLGATTTGAKVYEASEAMDRGAQEIDMVINIGELKAKHDARVVADIQAVVEATHKKGGLVKVIIETALLSGEEKVRACQLIEQAGADFVKTSTGFSTSGARAEDVALIRQTVGDRLRIKAAGGIHTYAEAMKMIDAGANRIGASAGLKIIRGE